MKIKYQSTMPADGHYPPMICRVQCRCYWMRQMLICIKINNHVISSSRRFILIKRYHIRTGFSISAEALLQYHWSVFHQTHHIQKVKKHRRFLCGAARKYSDNFMTNLHTNTELFKNLSESYLLNLWLYYKLTFVILSHNNIVKTLLVFPTGFYRLLI